LENAEFNNPDPKISVLVERIRKVLVLVGRIWGNGQYS
jgi:hypothetical protein